MKHLKLTTAATILTLTLSFSAFAGDMYGGFVDVPPQPTITATTTSSNQTTTGTTTTTTSAATADSQSTAVDALTQLVISVLNLLP